MDSVQTLHDFALNLLQDPAALAGFGQDPQGALAAAGLGDVSAADVHEVMPLVLDYLPVDNVSNLGGVGSLTGDVAHTGTDAGGVQGAIEQLQALTAGLGAPSVSDLPGVGGLGSAVPGLGDLGSAVPGLPAVNGLPGVNEVTNTAATIASNPTNALSVAGDLSHGLDATPLAGLTGVAGQLPDAGLVAGTASHFADLGRNLGGEVVNDTTAPVYNLTDQANTFAGVGSHVADMGVATTNHLADMGVATTNHLADMGVGTTNHLADIGNNFAGAAEHITDNVGNLSGSLSHASSFGAENHGGGHHGGGLIGDVTRNLNVEHNHVVADVTSHVGDVASGSGVSDVHDVVSGVADLGHNALGNLHLGDLASNNDVHLHH